MAHRSAIISLAPEDIWAKGYSKFIAQGSAYADDSDVSATISLQKGSDLIAERSVVRSRDIYGKITGDVFTFSADIVSPGEYSLTMLTRSLSKSEYRTSKIYVYDRPDVVYQVESSEVLGSVLAAIKTQNIGHAKIILTGTTYPYFPSDAIHDLSSSDTLVSFESTIRSVVSSVAPKIKRAIWDGIDFTTTADVGVAFKAAVGSIHVLRRCQFSSAAVGVIGSGANVRVEDSSYLGCDTCALGVKIVRNTSWRYSAGTIFTDCSVVYGTTGFRTTPSSNAAVAEIRKSAYWAQYYQELSPYAVNNVVSDDYCNLISGSKVTNACFVGNSMMTTAPVGWSFASLESSVIMFNTVTQPSGGVSFTVSAAVSKNAVVNNWFDYVDQTAVRASFNGRWEGNGTRSTTRANGTKTFSNPRFQNKFMFPSVSSPLNRAGVPVPSVDIIQGQAVAGQIGALSYHPDVELASVYSKVVNDPYFGSSLRDSTLGDLVSSNPIDAPSLQFQNAANSSYKALI